MSDGFSHVGNQVEALAQFTAQGFQKVDSQLEGISTDVTELKRTVGGDHENRLRHLEELEA